MEALHGGAQSWAAPAMAEPRGASGRSPRRGRAPRRPCQLPTAPLAAAHAVAAPLATARGAPRHCPRRPSARTPLAAAPRDGGGPLAGAPRHGGARYLPAAARAVVPPPPRIRDLPAPPPAAAAGHHRHGQCAAAMARSRRCLTPAAADGSPAAAAGSCRRHPSPHRANTPPQPPSIVPIARTRRPEGSTVDWLRRPLPPSFPQ
jgi:hypothetical protein